MAPNILATLAASGIIERPRRGRELRVTSRFLAHAEGTAGRLRALGTPTDDRESLRVALTTWDDFHGDARPAAVELEHMMADRHQLGSIAPLFPMAQTA